MYINDASSNVGLTFSEPLLNIVALLMIFGGSPHQTLAAASHLYDLLNFWVRITELPRVSLLRIKSRNLCTYDLLKEIRVPLKEALVTSLRWSSAYLIKDTKG